MDELIDKKLDQTESINSNKDQVINKPNLISQDDKNKTNANKLFNSKLATNGLATKFSSSKTIPLILKRSRLNEKVDCSESNENIDENKDRKDKSKVLSKAPNELVQRSSSRKKIKKTFGNDFLHMDVKQYSSSSLAKSSTASTTVTTTKKSRTKECFYCSTKNGDLFFCKICRLKAHENCFLNNLAVIREGYKNKVVICSQCRECEMCTDKNGSFYFCKRCSSCFHHQCDTNLARYIKPTFGKWQCSFCDRLDSIYGDTLTEETRKKEITKRKLIRMRKRLRKSDYILDDGICSIQQLQAVKKPKKCNVSLIMTDYNDASLNSNDKNEIDLSEDELINSKHILNESQKLDIWLDDEIDFIKLEDFLKRERKFNSMLSKRIKADEEYFVLVKLFIDNLKDSKFNCKKYNFLKLLSSDQFKKSFFESSSLNGLKESSTFLEAYTKLFEIKFQNDYWRPDDADVNDPINKSDYLTKNVQNKQDSDNELNNESNNESSQNLNIELNNESIDKDLNDQTNKVINEYMNEEVNLEVNNESDLNEDTCLNKATNDSSNEFNLNEDKYLQEEINLKLNQIEEQNEMMTNKNDKKQIDLDLECNEEFSHDENMVKELIVQKSSNSKEKLELNENLLINQQTTIILDHELINEEKKNELDLNVSNQFNDSQKLNNIDKVIDLNSDKDNKITYNLIINDSKDFKQDDNDESMNNDLLCKETIDIDTELNNKFSNEISNLNDKKLNNNDKFIEELKTNLEPSTSNCQENNLGNNLYTKLKIKTSSNNLVDKLFKQACKYNLNLLEPKHWSIDDVSIYLKQIGFDKEAEYFKEKKVDGNYLLNLTRQEILNNFNIKIGPAVKIAAYVNDLQIKNKCNISFD